MNRTDEILMLLLQSGIEGGKIPARIIEPISPEQWHEVFRLAARQGVLAIVYDALAALPPETRPSREFMLRWAVNTDRIEHDYAHKRDTLAALAALFAKHGIRTMVLKGYGLASYYPVPAHRPCGDIDLWLYGKQPEADQLVRTELGIPVRNEVHHHTLFTYRNVLIENHFDFLNLWSHRSNRELERTLRRYADLPGKMLSVNEATVFLPSPQLNALFLMRHMAVHFAAAEIGLRHLADWAVFLRAEGSEVDWPAMRALYQAQNMLRFADAVTGLCVKWLGVKQDIYTFTDDAALQETILQETLHPAFGEKHPTSGLFKPAWFKFRRWWANRWKHRLVYKDSLIGSFLWLCWAHLIRPKTIAR